MCVWGAAVPMQIAKMLWVHWLGESFEISPLLPAVRSLPFPHSYTVLA